MMNRRNFLGALAVFSSVGGSALGVLLASRPRLAVKGITPAGLKPLAGSSVVIRGTDSRTVRAVVADVHSLRTPSRFGTPGTEQISILLRVEDPDPQAGIYRVESDDLVLGDLYFSPVGLAGNQRRLEAVITRIV